MIDEEEFCIQMETPPFLDDEGLAKWNAETVFRMTHRVMNPTKRLLNIFPPEAVVSRDVWPQVPAVLEGLGYAFDPIRRVWVNEEPTSK